MICPSALVFFVATAKLNFQVHSFLITNLAIGDFFMGCYLLVIAIVDANFRGVYSMHDKEWRTSSTCSFAGFLSTFSSEFSVFTLTVITLDRFLVCTPRTIVQKKTILRESLLFRQSHDLFHRNLQMPLILLQLPGNLLCVYCNVNKSRCDRHGNHGHFPLMNITHCPNFSSNSKFGCRSSYFRSRLAGWRCTRLVG